MIMMFIDLCFMFVLDLFYFEHQIEDVSHNQQTKNKKKSHHKYRINSYFNSPLYPSYFFISLMMLMMNSFLLLNNPIL